ncbi:uncharacterized protein [Salmo salar]|uniref:Uncharacterized protein n=1 Tax=Salmo salar TaxID=8030 RepID=A0ABM3CXB6_SALSA|nr:uncharacterized protein LOC123727130 [Salmo salar]
MKGVAVRCEAFIHVYGTRLTLLHWSYKENGLMPPIRKRAGPSKHRLHLKHEDLQRVVNFINNYAEDNAIVLPGRHPHKHLGGKLLPPHVTKAAVWHLYKESMTTLEVRVVGLPSFRNLWGKLLPHISSTAPHLKPSCLWGPVLNQQEKTLGCIAALILLNKCTSLQPGPIYFLTPHKCGLFGVCCEGIPQQVNYLIDEGMLSSKVKDSTLTGVNIPQLVGLEDGTVLVESYCWQQHLTLYFRLLLQIKQYQHFSFDVLEPGVVAKERSDSVRTRFQLLCNADILPPIDGLPV